MVKVGDFQMENAAALSPSEEYFSLKYLSTCFCELRLFLYFLLRFDSTALNRERLYTFRPRPTYGISFLLNSGRRYNVPFRKYEANDLDLKDLKADLGLRDL